MLMLTCYKEDAMKYGLDKAVLLYHLIYWIEHNYIAHKHHHDGRTWLYGTAEYFSNFMGVWSIPQVKRLLKGLVEEGVLITGNYNKTPYDRTLWYAFNDESMFLFRKLSRGEKLGDVEDTEDDQEISAENEESVDENTEKQSTNSYYRISKNDKSNTTENRNGINEFVPPIPGINKYKNTGNNKYNSMHTHNSFDSPPSSRFKKPTIEEVSEYCKERENKVDPMRFMNYYESKGWKIGRSPMKDWKAAVRTWEQNDFKVSSSPPLKVQQRTTFLDLPEA